MSRQFRMNLTYTDEEFAFKKNLYAIYDLDTNYDYKFVLGILNSSLFSFMQVNFNTSLQRDDFPAFSLKDFKEFSIPKTEKARQKIFAILVDQILVAKAADPKADTRGLEKQIDKMVYELYGLTEDEIIVVEGKGKEND